MESIDIPSEELLQSVITCFWESFPPTWANVRARVRATAAEVAGITPEQYHVLRHIRKGAHSVSELATIKQISRSAVSQAVDTLVDRGLVARQHTAGDRRFVRLELTPAGDALLTAIFTQNRAWMSAKLAALSPAQLDTLQQSLDLLKAIFVDSAD